MKTLYTKADLINIAVVCILLALAIAFGCHSKEVDAGGQPAQASAQTSAQPPSERPAGD